MGISQEWYRGMKEDEIPPFRELLQNSGTVLRQLAKVLDVRLQGLTTVELNPDTYDTPAWGYKQADINGARRMLRDIRNLVTLT